jgi:hypothetical protein
VQPAPPPAPPPVTVELPPFDVTPEQLAQAIRARDRNRVTVLLAQGADPNALATDGNDALHLAVAEGDPNLVRLLLDDPRTDVDRRSRTGDTPLHVAAAEGHTGAITRILIEGGADENALDAQRRTPQQRAVAGGHGDEDDPPSDPAPFYPPMLIAGLLMFALVAVPEIVKPDPERRQSPFVRLWAVISVTVAAAGIPGMPSFLLVPASGAQVAGLTLDDGQINAGAAGVVFLGLTAVFFRNEVVDVLNAIANLIRGTDK